MALIAIYLPDVKMGQVNKPLLADALRTKEAAQPVLVALRDGQQVRATALAEAQAKAARAAQQRRSELGEARPGHL